MCIRIPLNKQHTKISLKWKLFIHTRCVHCIAKIILSKGHYYITYERKLGFVWRKIGRRTSAVGTATCWTATVRFPLGARYFSVGHRVQRDSGTYSASYPMGTRTSSVGLKRPEHELTLLHLIPKSGLMELHFRSSIILHRTVLK
jgi:hypothetical protein